MWLVVVGFAHAALAQAPGQAEPVSSAFLEKRVPDELAADGLVLSRRNLALQVEQIGDRWLVSLADLTTGSVVASTKIETLPTDREAAVASMTHVAAELVARSERLPAPAPAPPPPVVPSPDPAPVPPAVIEYLAKHDRAELNFKRHSIRFGANYQLLGSGTSAWTSAWTSRGTSAWTSTALTSPELVRRWVAYQGDIDHELEPEEFYATVGRPDLADRYRSRHHIMIGSFIAGSVIATAGAVVLLEAPHRTCSYGDPTYDTCLKDRHRELHNILIETSVVLGVSAIVCSVGLYLYVSPHPIDEDEAKSLGNEYNQRLRKELGLPTLTQRRPRLQDVRWTPYVTDRQVGGALSARF